MPAIVFLGLIGAGLFALAFITKRRFGILGLALAAGALISNNWATILTPILQGYGLQIDLIPLSVVVQAGLVLLPSLLLLFSGQTYESTWLRTAGATLFAVLAVVFLLQPLGEVLRLDGPSLQLYNAALKNQSIVIVLGLLFAVVDVLFARSSHKPKH